MRKYPHPAGATPADLSLVRERCRKSLCKAVKIS